MAIERGCQLRRPYKKPRSDRERGWSRRDEFPKRRDVIWLATACDSLITLYQKGPLLKSKGTIHQRDGWKGASTNLRVFYVCPATDHARLYKARNKNEFVSISDMPLPVSRKIHAPAALHRQRSYAAHLIAI